MIYSYINTCGIGKKPKNRVFPISTSFDITVYQCGTEMFSANSHLSYETNYRLLNQSYRLEEAISDSYDKWEPGFMYAICNMSDRVVNGS